MKKWFEIETEPQKNNVNYNVDYDDDEFIDISLQSNQSNISPKLNEVDYQEEVVIKKSPDKKVEDCNKSNEMGSQLNETNSNGTLQPLNQTLIQNSMNTSLQQMNPMYQRQEIQPFNQQYNQDVSMYNQSNNVNELMIRMGMMNTVNMNNDELNINKDKLFDNSSKFNCNNSSMYKMENINHFNNNYDNDIDINSKFGEMTAIGNSLNLNGFEIEPLELSGNEMDVLRRDVPVEVLGCDNDLKNLIQILRTANNTQSKASRIDISNYLEGRGTLYNTLKKYKELFKNLNKEFNFNEDEDLNDLFHAYMKFMTKHLDNPSTSTTDLTKINTRYGHFELDNIEDLLLLYRYDMDKMGVKNISNESFYEMLNDRVINYFNFYMRYNLERSNAFNELNENFRVIKKINCHYLNTINSLKGNLSNLNKLIEYVFNQHIIDRQLIGNWNTLRDKINEIINGNNVKNENIKDIYDQINNIRNAIQNESDILRGTIQTNRNMIDSNNNCIKRLGTLLSIIANTDDFNTAQMSLTQVRNIINNPNNNISKQQLQQINDSTEQLIISNLKKFDQCLLSQYSTMLNGYVKTSTFNEKIARLSQLDGILTRLTSIETDIGTFKNNNISLLRESNDKLKTDVVTLQKDKIALSNKVNELDTNVKEMRSLLNKLLSDFNQSNLLRKPEESVMMITHNKNYSGKEEFIKHIKSSIGKESIIQDYSHEVKLCGVNTDNSYITVEMIVKNDYDIGIYKKWLGNVLSENISLDEYINLRKIELEKIHKSDKLEINGIDHTSNKSLYIAEYILQVIEELNKYNINFNFKKEIKLLVNNCNNLLNGTEHDIIELINQFNSLVDSLIKEFNTIYSKDSGYITITGKKVDDELLDLKSKFDKILYKFSKSGRDKQDAVNALNDIMRLFKVKIPKVEGISNVIKVIENEIENVKPNDEGILPLKNPFKLLTRLIYAFNQLFNSRLSQYSIVLDDKSGYNCYVDSNGNSVTTN